MQTWRAFCFGSPQFWGHLRKIMETELFGAIHMAGLSNFGQSTSLLWQRNFAPISAKLRRSPFFVEPIHQYDKLVTKVGQKGKQT